MKKMVWILSWMLLSTGAAFSARMPELRVEIGDGTQPLALKDLKVEITLRRHLARTVFTLTYANERDEELAGDFFFPLPAGGTVTDVALLLDGKWRHAAAVEREQGRVAFDDAVHRRVDPALAEWMAGNVFRLGVYPIPAKGEKQVMLAYDELLGRNKRGLQYALDLTYGIPLRAYEIRVDAGEGFEPAMDAGLRWSPQGGRWEVSERESTLNGKVAFALPVRDPQPAVAEYAPREGVYYLSLPVTPDLPARTMPTTGNLLLLWDTSGSMSKASKQRVFGFLEAFLNLQRRDVDVVLVPFHQKVEEPRVIPHANRAGGFQLLRQEVDGLLPCGATDLADLFRALPRVLKGLPGRGRVLLVTDGLDVLNPRRVLMETLAGLEALPVPVLAVNASAVHDPLILEQVAVRTKGWTIDLASDAGVGQALRQVMAIPVRVSVQGWTQPAGEALPRAPLLMSAGQTFWFHARVPSIKARDVLTLQLETPAGRRTAPYEFETQGIEPAGGLARGAFGRARVQELMADPATPREELVAAGKQFGMLTPATSLIVLENCWDYINHEIEMPPEVKEECQKEIQEFEQMKVESQQAEERAETEARRQEQAREQEQEERARRELQAETERRANEERRAQEARIEQQRRQADLLHMEQELAELSARSAEGRPSAAARGKTIIWGTVLDDNHQPLPGVEVSIAQGNGSVLRLSDDQGRFLLRVEPVPSYTVRFVMEGFAETEMEQVRPSSSGIAHVTVNLQPVFEERVTVTGMAPAVEATATTMGVEGGVEMAPGGRTFQSMLEIPAKEAGSVPGASLAGEGNRYLIDGIETTDPVGGTGDVAYDFDAVIELPEDPGDMQVDEDGDPESAGLTPGQAAFLEQRKALMQKVLNADLAPSERKIAYLQARSLFWRNKNFFLDAAAALAPTDPALASRVLLDLVEYRGEDAGTLLTLAQKMEAADRPDLAGRLLERAVDLSPMEPQPLRELGLFSARHGQVQEARRCLERVAAGQWAERFPSIVGIAKDELGRLPADPGGQAIDPDRDDSKDLKVILNWDTNWSDIDLHVVEPTGEEVYYGHRDSRSGGHITDDITGGFGPEIYSIAKAPRGTYRIFIEYYGSDRTSIDIVTMIHVVVYSRESGTIVRREYPLVLQAAKDRMDIATVVLP